MSLKHKLDYKKFLKVYLWVLSFLKPYRLMLLAYVGCGLIVSIGEIVIPRYMQYFIDTIIPRSDLNAFRVSFIVLVAVVIAIIAFTAISNVLERMIREYAGRDVKQTLIQHLRVLGFSYYENNPSGKTMAMLTTDVGQLQKTYTEYIKGFTQILTGALITGSLLFMVDVKLLLLAFACVLLHYMVQPLLSKKIVEYLELQTTTKHDLDQRLYDSVSSFSEVKAMGAIDWAVQVFTEKYIIFKNTRLTSLFWRCSNGFLAGLIYAISCVVFFAYSYFLFRAGKITTGSIVSNSMYFAWFVMHFPWLVFLKNEQLNVLKHCEYLYDFKNTKPTIREPEKTISLTKVQGRLTFRNVAFQYVEGSPVLKDFNLDILPGERVALVGVSGGGKTTALKLAARFYDPDAGQVLLDGIPLKELAFEELRDALGFVFQDAYLFGASIKENIRFGKPNATDEEVIQAAKMAHIHEFIMATAQGYDTLVGERGIKLSGGQKQRVAIARMMIKNPRIILLDEATSALDNVSENYIKASLDEFHKGRTTIAVAHRLSTIEDYDRIVVLNDGEIAEEGNYQQLYAKKGIFYEWTKRSIQEEVAS